MGSFLPNPCPMSIIVTIPTVSCIESYQRLTIESVIKLVEVVDEEDVEKKMKAQPKVRGVRFDPSLNFNANIPCASFLSKLIVAQRESLKKEVIFIQSFDDMSST